MEDADARDLNGGAVSPPFPQPEVREKKSHRQKNFFYLFINIAGLLVQVIIDTEVNVRKYDLGEVRNGALGQVRSAKGEVKVNLHRSCNLCA